MGISKIFGKKNTYNLNGHAYADFIIKKIPVSVIIMTKNEGKNIAECLDGVKDFGEIFVVDSGSNDET